MLRQAPNIIMVGEIRDSETGNIAVNASLTGHFVFSTLHTNDAPGAMTRMIDMGVETFPCGGSLSVCVGTTVGPEVLQKLCAAAQGYIKMRLTHYS